MKLFCKIQAKLSLIDSKQIKYIIVGIWNTFFSYAAFVMLYYLLNVSVHYMAILVLSQIVGLTNAYICYKVFVFKTKGNIVREYLRFYVVYGTTFVVNLALIALFVEILTLNPVVSQGVIAFIVVIMAYIGHDRFSFNS